MRALPKAHASRCEAWKRIHDHPIVGAFTQAAANADHADDFVRHWRTQLTFRRRSDCAGSRCLGFRFRNVAGFHPNRRLCGRPDARGRAREDMSPGQRHARVRAEHVRHMEHHVIGGGGLHDFAVQPGLDLQALGRRAEVHRRRRTTGRRRRCRRSSCQRPLRGFQLIVAHRAVVEDRVADDRLRAIRWRQSS